MAPRRSRRNTAALSLSLRAISARTFDGSSFSARSRRRQPKQGALLRPRDDPQQGTYFGTVGAVALDKAGNLAAATSTGGVTNKRFGRVGDSPIIGAGTYASNQSCAHFVDGNRRVLHPVFGRARHLRTGGVSRHGAQQAADEVVQDVLKPAGGDGGVIGLDRFGRVVMSFNTTGMSRGYIGENGDAVIMFTTEDGARDPAEIAVRVTDSSHPGRHHHAGG